jgi:3-methyladenine DNA glycosylase Tag
MEQEQWQMPKWWYREKHPPNDDAYFEYKSRVIFQSRLKWQVVDKKWSAIKKPSAGLT